MSEPLQIVFVVVVITLVLLLMGVAMAGLLVVNANRRVKHRLELEAAQRKLQEELVRAEREATQETMHHIGRELHDIRVGARWSCRAPTITPCASGMSSIAPLSVVPSLRTMVRFTASTSGASTTGTSLCLGPRTE